MNGKKWIFWLLLAAGALTFISLIHSILLPFVLGILTAYFLDPAADRLEKTGCSRTVATVIITCCFFSVIALLVVLIVPLIASQLAGLIEALPSYIRKFDEQYTPTLTHWLGALPTEHVERVQAMASEFSGTMVTKVGDFIAGLFLSGMAVINLLSLALISPVVAFYLLKDWDGIVTRAERLLPRAHEQTIREQFILIDATLSAFIRGQLNVCLMMGTFYAIGLSLVGLPFSIVIGIATGFLAIVPYVGFFLGMVTGLAVAFFQFDTWHAITAVLAVFMAGQVIESYFVTPKLVGDKVGLHPVWIIFGLLAGGALLGFVGVLLAVPLTAVIGVLIRFAVSRYEQSSYYSGDKRKA